MAEWLKATDCKSVLSEYAGSNPASSTKRILPNGVVIAGWFGLPWVFCISAGVAQLVEHLPSKQDVASSNLVARSINRCWHMRPCGSVVEHSLGKGEVAGPIPAMGTMKYVFVSV